MPANHPGFASWIRASPPAIRRASAVTWSRVSGRAQISSVVIAATQPSSAPPNVDMCAKPSSVSQPAACSAIRTAVIG
jgi:hypothetical protein